MNNSFLVVGKDLQNIPDELIYHLDQLKNYDYRIVNTHEAIDTMYTKNYHFLVHFIRKQDELYELKEIVEEFSCIPLVVVSFTKFSKDQLKTPWLKKAQFFLVKENLTTLLENYITKTSNNTCCSYDGSLHRFIFKSSKMQELYHKINLIKNTNSPILITGESGTGKQIVSRMIHYTSDYKNRPFMELNCATLPTQLLESEFFGHEKGAFSGAYNAYEGKLKAVKDGTLFLDEIGEMDIHVQSKLLNVLEKRPFYSIGSNKEHHFNGRIIIATNKDLRQAILDKEFRRDLYYRLNVFHIHIPPLRERKEDIRLLAEYFFYLYLKKYNKNSIFISSCAYQFLENYEFEGNVRELSNLIERFVLTFNSKMIITAKDIKEMLYEDNDIDIDIQAQPEPQIKPSIEPPKPFQEPTVRPSKEYVFNNINEIIPLKKVLQNEEKKYLSYLMNKYTNMSQLAQKLNIERSSLYRKVKRYHLLK